MFVHSICDSTRWFELGDLADVWWCLPGHVGRKCVPVGSTCAIHQCMPRCVLFAAKDMRFIPLLRALMSDIRDWVGCVI